MAKVLQLGVWDHRHLELDAFLNLSFVISVQLLQISNQVVLQEHHIVLRIVWIEWRRFLRHTFDQYVFSFLIQAELIDHLRDVLLVRQLNIVPQITHLIFKFDFLLIHIESSDLSDIKIGIKR